MTPHRSPATSPAQSSKKHSKRTAASTATARKSAKAPTVPKKRNDKKLSAWLQCEARKLKDLKAKEKRLKLDFVANARSQGRILAAVKKRLASTPLRFEEWVKKNTDIGYSTALLWIDLAQNYAKVKAHLADSNPLELTIRKIRDAIRDERQAQGKGKPQSGKQVHPSHQEAAQGPHDAQPAEVTNFQHGCKDFKIENDRTLSFTNQRGERVFVVSEKKGIERLLVKALTSYTGKGGGK